MRLKLYKSKLFIENHKLFPYYISGICYQKIERLFQNNSINVKYKRFKNHILMQIVSSILKKPMPNLNSNEIEKLCSEIFTLYLNENQFTQTIFYIISSIQTCIDNHTGNIRNLHNSKEFTDDLLPDSYSNKTEGKIRYYNDQRGYGFIDIGVSSDIFFHISEYRKNIEIDPQLSQTISFDIVDSDNGLKAINIEMAQ